MANIWTLDSAISTSYDVVIKIKSLFTNVICTSASSSNETVISLLNKGSANSAADANIVKNVEVIEYEYKYVGGTLNYGSEYVIQDENNNDVAKIYFDTGQIEFYVITAPPIDGEDNIEIEFTPKNLDYYNENYITNCEFGMQFGVEGYKDRLFLSGNKDHPNVLFYSEFDDFTYFPYVNMQSLGNDNNPIVAFSRLNDSTVAIHKKNDNVDPSIYYMTYSINENYESTGIDKYSFPIVSGVLGESPVNSDTCFNLSGDNLFLSENGVYGIELNENIKSNERFALERSGLINSMLSKHNNLSNAKAIVYKNRYYLAIDDVVYVADARLKSSARTGDMKDTFNYEWYYWTNIPVKKWIISNNKLYFIDQNNDLNMFYDGYEDIRLKVANIGNLTAAEDSHYKIAYNSAYDELFESSEKLMIEFPSHIEGECLPDIGENTILTGKYYIVDIDYYNHTFSISLDPDGIKKIKITYVISAGITAYIYYSNTVKSIWKTPILSLGTTTYSKNLLSSTLVCEPSIEGCLQYGCRTNNKLIKSNSELRPVNGLDFENFDFTNFSFEDGLARSRTIKTRIRNFNFIEFIIKSDDDKDCAINNFTITYNIGRKNKGVR